MLRAPSKPAEKPEWPKHPTLTWSPIKRCFIWIGAPWHKLLPKNAGLRYNASNQTWETTDFDKAAKLREWGDETAKGMLGDLTATKASTAIANADALRDSRATDADIDVPVPEGLTYMGFQRGGVAYAWKRFKGDGAPKTAGVLIADEPGLGKTIQAAGLINIEPAFERVLVVCPASLKINWKRELDKWLVRKRTTMIASPSYFPAGAFIVVINYDNLKKFHRQIYAREWDLVVLDEAHLTKNEEAIRSEEAHGIPTRWRLYLTGTPIVNRPMEIYPLLHQLDPETFGDRHKFEAHFGHVSPNTPLGRKRLAELQSLMRSTCMIRRLKADVLKDLPAKTRQIIEIPADSVGKEVQDEQRELMAFLEVVQRKQLSVELAKSSPDFAAYQTAVGELRSAVKDWLESISVLRHKTAIAKVPTVVRHVRDLLDAGEKIILFAHHRDVIEAYMEAFGHIAVKVDGSMSGPKGMRDRQAAVDAFQKDPGTRVFVGQFQAAGVGLTLTAARIVVFGELDWVPGMMTQAEDRAHRHGQTENVLIQHIVLMDSLDAYMAKTLVAKQKVIEAATDAADERAQLAEQPLVPSGDEHATAHITYTRITQDAERLTSFQVAGALSGVAWLAEHGREMNRIDESLCKALAEVARPTGRQAALARRVARKYRGVMPPELQEGLR